jgi:hypothetical protein
MSYEVDVQAEDAWETECPKRDDRQHCDCWYDGKPCCACGEAMNFGAALEQLREGFKMQRIGWNGKGMWLALQTPDENSKMNHPYIYMSDVNGKLFPWNPNNLDLLATDWQVAD